MSIYEDYMSNYFQAIQKYKNSIDLQVIKQSIDTVIDFVRYSDSEPNERLDFRDKSKILGEETYKFDVFEKAHAALCINDWDVNTIGDGSICKHVADAMTYTDNLVNRRFVVPEFLDKLKTPDKQQRSKYEHALYEIYCGSDEEKAFKDAISSFKGKYSLLAFLFFIKDKDRFLPTSSETFDSIFSEMGLPFKMQKRCSWENYCEFLAIISSVKDYLSGLNICNHEISLLDAHSIVWIMNYEKYKTWCNTSSDINTPMIIKKRIENSDGTINYQCPRCDYSFKRNGRCPACGQLVKE